MYIFYLFFQFTMIPETTKDPGSICTIAKNEILNSTINTRGRR